MTPSYTTIIGLEVHVQLATKSKLFCRCSTQFGQPPNTQTCPVCLGLPGALPVMNRKAYNLALRTAVALNCNIPAFTKWDRKQYYYPDLPKGYQISQFDLPMSSEGFVEIEDAKGRFAPKKVRLIRAHLEEDAGKSIHNGKASGGQSQIDLNRTGTPLLEIVSEPDMNCPLEARAFLDALKLLLTYIDVSDCNMQEGSLRVDANINLHIKQGEETVATPIVEIKNMNSFRAVERALAYEETRQFKHWQETGEVMGQISKQTRGWDDAAGVTRAQRGKEESSDYRYLPDPDLIPVLTSQETVEEVKQSLCELPAAFQKRLQEDYKLSNYDAVVIVQQGRPVVEYFLRVADESKNPKQAANWVTQDVLREMKEASTTIEEFAIPPTQLAKLIIAITSGKLPSARGRDVFRLMNAKSCNVEEAMAELQIETVDEDALKSLCQELLNANPKVVADVQGGNPKALGAIIGQAKKKNRNADPARVREICLELLQ